jgi:hypothetical protein
MYVLLRTDRNKAISNFGAKMRGRGGGKGSKGIVWGFERASYEPRRIFTSLSTDRFICTGKFAPEVENSNQASVMIDGRPENFRY